MQEWRYNRVKDAHQSSDNRLQVIASALSANGTPRRSPKLIAKQRAALKLQGNYMGTMRGLKPAQRAKVKKVRAAKGIRGAIAEARSMMRPRCGAGVFWRSAFLSCRSARSPADTGPPGPSTACRPASRTPLRMRLLHQQDPGASAEPTGCTPALSSPGSPAPPGRDQLIGGPARGPLHSAEQRHRRRALIG